MMDKEERQYLAREILNNPLFTELCERIEKDAVDRCVAANYADHEARLTAAADIRAIRTFRQNCEAILRNNPVMKAAPA